MTAERGFRSLYAGVPDDRLTVIVLANADAALGAEAVAR